MVNESIESYWFVVTLMMKLVISIWKILGRWSIGTPMVILWPNRKLHGWRRWTVLTNITTTCYNTFIWIFYRKKIIKCCSTYYCIYYSPSMNEYQDTWPNDTTLCKYVSKIEHLRYLYNRCCFLLCFFLICSSPWFYYVCCMVFVFFFFFFYNNVVTYTFFSVLVSI